MSLRRNPALVCAYHALMMSLFPMAIITLFYRREIGMSMADIFLLQGGFGLGMVLLEFPSGYLADRVGYRFSLIVAALAAIGGWALYAVGESFAAVAVAELVLGASTAFISGSDAALLYESLKETGREEEYGKWWGRYTFAGQTAEGAAALTAGFLFSLDPRLPFRVQVGIWVLNLGVALAIVEPARHRPVLRKNLEQMKGIVRHVARENPALRATMLLAIALGMSSFIPVWTIQSHASGQGLPESWLGPMWAFANFSVALGGLLAHRLERRFGFARCGVLFVVLVALGYLGLGIVRVMPGFAFYFLLTAMRGLQYPIVGHREQRLVGSSDRAGFLSFRSFVFRGSFLALAWPVGASIDRFGPYVPMLVVGAGLVTAAAFALRAVLRETPATR
ncbi:MAG: MFS transporter [Planctomycetota bacterium]